MLTIRCHQNFVSILWILFCLNKMFIFQHLEKAIISFPFFFLLSFFFKTSPFLCPTLLIKPRPHLHERRGINLFWNSNLHWLLVMNILLKSKIKVWARAPHWGLSIPFLDCIALAAPYITWPSTLIKEHFNQSNVSHKRKIKLIQKYITDFRDEIISFVFVDKNLLN